MSFSIGTMVSLNGKAYKIVGTKDRSYLLERDGKTYKATANKLQKIQEQNSRPKAPAATVRSALDQRVAWAKIFNPAARKPETEAEIMGYFETLRCDLSPENLCCDGEATQAQIRAKLRDIKACWAELEGILGRKVAE